jgi:hypothetical protein
MYIWMSLQAKCYRCGCTATIYIWMVAGGIQIQTGHLIENFLFRIFETCFQSFLKTFWCFENLFLCFPKNFWSFTRIFILSNGTPHICLHQIIILFYLPSLSTENKPELIRLISIIKIIYRLALYYL